jgi:hypothetical protein
MGLSDSPAVMLTRLPAAIAALDDKKAAELRRGPASAAVKRVDVALAQLIAFDAAQGSRLSTYITTARRRTASMAHAAELRH